MREPQAEVEVAAHLVGFAREQEVGLVQLEVKVDFDSIVSVAVVYMAVVVLVTLAEEVVVAFVQPTG